MEEFPAVSQFITGAKMILTEPEKRWQMWEIYTAVQFAVSRLLNVTALKSIFLKLITTKPNNNQKNKSDWICFKAELMKWNETEVEPKHQAQENVCVI